jgi:hypothetical protein
MTRHVLDRLSAYLDGELAPADRQAVEAHLGVCDECARHLEDLAAVDELARALPLEAPGGYFEALPARVRFKVAPRRRVSRVPAWSWAAGAVAAAVLVAVVTPALLKRNPELAEVPRSVAPAAGPAATEASGGATEPSSDAKAPAGRPKPLPQPEAEPSAAAAMRQAEPSAAARDELRTAPKRVALGEAGAAAPPAIASAAPAAPAPTAGGALARNLAAAPLAKAEAPAADAQALQDKEASPRKPGQAPSTPVATAAFAPPPPTSAAEGAAGQHLYEPPAEKDEAESPAAAAAEAKKAGSAQASVKARRDGGGGRAEAAPRLRFRALEAEVPADLEAARRLREAWRGFVAQGAPAGQADEARVRIVEMGVQAWRFSNDPADLSLVKSDALAYLRRDDAAQGDRVRALMAALGN